MDEKAVTVRDLRKAKENLRATNLAFAAAVGRRADEAELLALAREVGVRLEEEYKLAAAARRMRFSLSDFWVPTTLPSTLPSVLG